MTHQVDPTIINAFPTKDFFVYMLVKDIGLIPAIIDLVDNSVDGARRIRHNEDYTGLTVRIDAKPDRFRIADNCGGIPVDLARNYAFRFGRPEGMPSIEHSVGQFGVGMKRALFKLGRRFRIESTTDVSRFVVDENVDEWKDKEPWQFKFKELEEDLSQAPAAEHGTIIEVAPLHESVSAEFGRENFRNHLVAELEAAHQDSMDKGLAISLNEVPLQIRLAELLHSDQLQPAYREKTFQEPGRPLMTAKIWAGISKSDPPRAGWYVFCNGRMVLEADQTLTTGWGEGAEATIPKYHNQFARFRGYVFFDCDDAGLLPWNTTKTDMDEDSLRYRAVRLEMISLMRPVIDFLNRLDAEKDRDENPLEAAIESTSAARLSDVRKASAFVSPEPDAVQVQPRVGHISYSRPLDEIERVKQVLNVATHREVGEKTFEYFFKMECAD